MTLNLVLATLVVILLTLEAVGASWGQMRPSLPLETSNWQLFRPSATKEQMTSNVIRLFLSNDKKGIKLKEEFIVLNPVLVDDSFVEKILQSEIPKVIPANEQISCGSSKLDINKQRIEELILDNKRTIRATESFANEYVSN